MNSPRFRVVLSNKPLGDNYFDEISSSFPKKKKGDETKKDETLFETLVLDFLAPLFQGSQRDYICRSIRFPNASFALILGAKQIRKNKAFVMIGVVVFTIFEN